MYTEQENSLSVGLVHQIKSHKADSKSLIVIAVFPKVGSEATWEALNVGQTAL